ncbi:hypothetical protein [Pseudomonas corrugata]|uniref:hypothetical protein n=1 Tax=Pseudomonas corrugata TaxID=47879 RepID=UPI0004666879|nr:hypothetical protein [Pseudomonas corrugata]
MHASLKFILATLLVSSPLMASAVEQAPTAPAQTSEATEATRNNVMTEHMQKMQAAYDKAAAAKTPAERRAAMQESMKTMRDSMAMLHEDCNGMGMGRGMMNMMMRMMDQQSSMMKMPMNK